MLTTANKRRKRMEEGNKPPAPKPNLPPGVVSAKDFLARMGVKANTLGE